MAEAWRPAETAPQDGSTILTCQMREDGPHFIDKAAWREASPFAPWVVLNGKVDRDLTAITMKMKRWRTPDGDFDVAAFTHWRPA